MCKQTRSRIKLVSEEEKIRIWEEEKGKEEDEEGGREFYPLFGFFWLQIESNEGEIEQSSVSIICVEWK